MKAIIVVICIALVGSYCQAGPVAPGPVLIGERTHKPPQTTCRATPTGEKEQEFNLDDGWSEIWDKVFPYACQCTRQSDVFFEGDWTDDAISFCQLKGCRVSTDDGDVFVPPNMNKYGCNCTAGGGDMIMDVVAELYGCEVGMGSHPYKPITIQ